jgi:hypothetical protein
MKGLGLGVRAFLEDILPGASQALIRSDIACKRNFQCAQTVTLLTNVKFGLFSWVGKHQKTFPVTS